MPEKLIPFDINIARKHPERIRYISSSRTPAIPVTVEFSEHHMILYWKVDSFSSTYKLASLETSYPQFKLAVATKKIMVQGYRSGDAMPDSRGYKFIEIGSPLHNTYYKDGNFYKKVGEPFEIEIEDIEV